jgi:hypothetical protein
MAVEIGDLIKIVATLAWLDGNLNQNVFAAEIVGTGGPYDDADIVDDAREWVEDMFATIIAGVSNEIDGSQVQVYKYDAVGDDFDEIGSDVWVYNPAVADDQLPRGVAGLLNAKTVDADVSGRKFLGGMVESNSTDGLWNSGVLALFVNFGGEWVQSFLGGTSGADWQPGVWSTIAKDVIQFSATVVIPTIPAYQRRRKRGVGV